MFKKGDKVLLHKGFYFGLANSSVGTVKKSDEKNTLVLFNSVGLEEVKTKHLKLLGGK